MARPRQRGRRVACRAPCRCHHRLPVIWSKPPCPRTPPTIFGMHARGRRRSRRVACRAPRRCHHRHSRAISWKPPCPPSVRCNRRFGTPGRRRRSRRVTCRVPLSHHRRPSRGHRAEVAVSPCTFVALGQRSPLVRVSHPTMSSSRSRCGALGKGTTAPARRRAARKRWLHEPSGGGHARMSERQAGRSRRRPPAGNASREVSRVR